MEFISNIFYIIFLYYSIFIVPLILVICYLWIVYLIIKKQIFKSYKLPILLFASHFLLSIVFEEYNRFASNDQYVTSSGDFGIELTFKSKLIGYVMILILLIFSFIALAKQTKLNLFVILLIPLSLLIYYKNLQEIVCGTNGNRWYDFHFFSDYISKEYIGCGPFYDVSLDSLNEQHKPGIEKISLINNDIVFSRHKQANFIIKRQFLFWQFDEEQIKRITKFYSEHKD